MTKQQLKIIDLIVGTRPNVIKAAALFRVVHKVANDFFASSTDQKRFSRFWAFRKTIINCKFTFN